MAGTQEARFNLVISARDEARGVFEQFVTGIKEQFDLLKQAVTETADQVKTDAQNIGQNITDGIKTASATAAMDTLDQLKQAAETSRLGVETAVTSIRGSMDTLNGIDSGMQLVNDLRDLRTAANGAGKAAETFGTKFETSMNQSASTASNARTTIVDDFDAIKQSVGDTTAIAIVDMDELKRTMDSVVQPAQHMKDALDFQNLQMAGQMVQDYGRQITGFFGDAVSSAVGFDQAVVNTAASLNSNLPEGIRLSAQAVANLQQRALDLGQTGFFSANQIAEAMNVMAKQGIDYQHIMSGGIETVSQVAAANQEDLASTANVVSDIMHEMGSSLKQQFGDNLRDQLTGIGDAMTATLHHARLSMDDFLNTMKFVGPQAGQVGVSVTDLSASIALLGEHGIRGSQAGTTLRRMLTNLTPASQAAAKVMSDLGMITEDGSNIFYDAAGKMKPLTEVQQILYDKIHSLSPEMQQFAVKTIFGQYALSGMTAIANTAPSAFNDLTDAMNKHGVTAELVAEKSQGWAIQVQALQAHFATLQKEIGERLKPVVEAMMGVLQNMMTAWDHLSSPVKNAIITFGALTGVVLLVGGGILAFLGTIGMLATSLAGIGLELSAIGAVMLPLTAIIAGVAAAVVGLSYAWNHDLGGIREKTQAVWDFVKQQFQAAMNYIMPLVEAAVTTLKAWWQDHAATFGQAIHNIYEFLVWLSPLWKVLWEVIKFIVKDVFDTIIMIIKGAWEVLSGVFQLFGDLLTGQWKKVWGDLWQIVVGMVKVIVGLFELGFVGRIGELFKVLGKAFELFEVAGRRIFEAFGKAIQDIAEALFQFLDTKTGGVLSDLVKLFQAAWDVIVKAFQAFSDLFHGDLEGFWKNVNSIVETGVQGAKTIFTDLFGWIDTAFNGLATKALDWGKNMIEMFVQGIESMVGRVEQAVSNVANKVKSFLGFHSPAEQGPAADSDQWMPNLMNMFRDGIVSKTPDIQKAISGVALGLQTSFQQTHTSLTTLNNTPGSVPASQNKQGVTNIFNINIDGRSTKTDSDLADMIAKRIRTQMSVVSIA